MQNKPIKKIFVCEFITAGGLNHTELDSSLINEGILMRDALLKDLASLPYELFITLDARLNLSVELANVQYIHANQDVWLKWEEIIKQVDAVWIIAPETNGYLQKLTQLALNHQKMIIGCGLKTIDICRSKLSSYYFFKQHKLNTVETFLSPRWDKTSSKKWIVKPDDGAGCEDTLIFDDADLLMDWIIGEDKVHTHVIQPYIEGIPASISCIMHKGHARVLSCNKLLMSINNNVLGYQGFLVNGMRSQWQLFTDLANRVAKLFPDASGYVGVDVMVSQSDRGHPEIKVLEVNPRLTTTYVALGEAIALNPAKLIIDTVMETCDESSYIERNEVLLKVAHA
ncbi:MAG: ATP-grasp domain-containing protein [Methylotenera sp.]